MLLVELLVYVAAVVAIKGGLLLTDSWVGRKRAPWEQAVRITSPPTAPPPRNSLWWSRRPPRCQGEPRVPGRAVRFLAQHGEIARQFDGFEPLSPGLVQPRA